jgi:hypothetical protein
VTADARTLAQQAASALPVMPPEEFARQQFETLSDRPWDTLPAADRDALVAAVRACDDAKARRVGFRAAAVVYQATLTRVTTTEETRP